MTSVTMEVPYKSSILRDESRYGGRFFGGNGMGHILYFDNDYTNVTQIDLTNLNNISGNVTTIRNTTKYVDGGFEISIYNSNNVRIGYKKTILSKGVTKSVSPDLGVYNFTGETISYINWRATDSGANTVIDVDIETETSTFTMTQTRNLVLTHTVSGTSVDLSWNGTTNNTYRVVKRIENFERNMPVDSDIVLAEISGATSTTISGLTAASTSRIVLQQLGTNWYDVQQEDITVDAIELELVSSGSTFVTFKWGSNGEGSVYTLVATSDAGSSSVTTTDIEATIQNLSPSVQYSFELSVV